MVLEDPKFYKQPWVSDKKMWEIAAKTRAPGRILRARGRAIIQSKNEKPGGRVK